MPVTPRVGIAVAALALLATGCSGDEDPPDVADPGPTSESPTDEATDDATHEPTEEEPALVFSDSTGSPIKNDCGDRSPTYVVTSQTLEVNEEVRLGEVTVAGRGSIVDEVFIAPAPRRGGPDRGLTVVDDEPGFGELTDQPLWGGRAALQGLLVQPGRYMVFLQVEVPAGPGIEGVDFASFDSNSTTSTQLALEVQVKEKCRG